MVSALICSSHISKLNAGGNPAMDSHPIQGGVEILLVAPCYRNWDKLWPDRPLGLYMVQTFLQLNQVTEKMVEKLSILGNCTYNLFSMSTKK